MLLGVIIYIVTDKGQIKIEVNDPNAVVKIDLERKGEGPERTAGRAPDIARGEPSASSTTPGFTPLFNGKDLAGWAGDVADYEVIDGAVTIRRGRRATIYYPKIYWDFAARVEFRLSPEGNSGLAIRYPGEGDPAYSGMCEVQILDGTAPRYQGIDPRAAHGSVFGLVAAGPGPLRPPGQWNTQEITVQGSTIRVELNGVTILDTDLGIDRDDMSSKPHPGKDRKGGYFGLFGVNFPVEFRKVEIKEISPLASLSRPGSDSADWVPLFNGRDLSGWQTAQPTHWRVENGLLTGSGPSPSYLYTKTGDYKDFHLNIEARINNGGNSGVFFRMPSADLRLGYEAQINISHQDTCKTGSLYRAPGGYLVRTLTTDTHPEEDFAMDVIAEGNHIQILVNGRKTTDFIDEDRMYARGYIALQLHNPMTSVRFRKIKIKEIRD